MPTSEDRQPSRRTAPDTSAARQASPRGETSPRRTSSRRENAGRLEEVFGQILPETTSDERESSWHEASGTSDDWYLENRPPHH